MSVDLIYDIAMVCSRSVYVVKSLNCWYVEIGKEAVNVKVSYSDIGMQKYEHSCFLPIIDRWNTITVMYHLLASI